MLRVSTFVHVVCCVSAPTRELREVKTVPYSLGYSPTSLRKAEVSKLCPPGGRFCMRDIAIFTGTGCELPGPKAVMALVGHADANSHAPLNTRKLPVYSTCRLCQQTQTLNLLVVVQGQCAANDTS
jgi:hypothetical protein